VRFHPSRCQETAVTALTQELLSQLQGAPLQKIAQQLGVDQSQASGAVGAALPLLMGALGKNASQPQGAESLLGALQRNHAGGGAGDLLGLLGSALGSGGGKAADGAGILGHVLGGRQGAAAQQLGAATGLGGERAGDLLKLLAPVVMGFLAKRALGGEGGGGAGALAGLLGQESTQLRQQGVAGGLMNAVLDRDGDGDVDLGDMLKLGGGLFGGKS
jgi:hypothetical protein